MSAENKITDRDRTIWRSAITLAHNFAVRDSNDINDRDGSLDAVHALSDCAKKIKAWIEPSNEQLSTLFEEGFVPEERASNAATKRELDAMRESRDEVNERLAALNEWVDFHKEELAATRQELESAKGLHQQCLDSVTMIIVTFPNAAEYVRQMEKQRDSALARVAELEAAIELARVGH